MKRSNVDSIKLSRFMIGCGAGYDFTYITLRMFQFYGYQLGRMKFKQTEAGKYRTKYYHSPVTELGASVVIPYGKCDFTLETIYVLFREKRRTDREVSFSAGGAYRL